MWLQWIQRIVADDPLLFDIALYGEADLLLYVSGIPIATILLSAIAPASVSNIIASNGPTRRKMNRIGVAGGLSLAIHKLVRSFGWTWILFVASMVSHIMTLDEILNG